VRDERINVVNPYELPVLFKTVREETKIEGTSVIITSQPCVLIKDYHKLKPYTVDRRQVHRLRQLHRCRLPGDPRHAPRQGVKPSGKEVDLAFVRIDSSACTGCGLCVQPCAPDAIVHVRGGHPDQHRQDHEAS
jgi:indolepyruvate ferredoxin oxidoreductase alpha subunit